MLKIITLNLGRKFLSNIDLLTDICNEEDYRNTIISFQESGHETDLDENLIANFSLHENHRTNGGCNGGNITLIPAQIMQEYLVSKIKTQVFDKI